MKRLLIVSIILTIAALLIAASGLQCYKIGWDLVIRPAYCYTNEFITVITTPEFTPTATVYILPPYPTSVPTATQMTYPIPETPNPYP